jgi:hypothetical protein
MSDRDTEFAAIRRRLPTARVVPSSIFVVPLSVLVVASVFGEFGQAAVTVGFVLAEAIVLYVGYGALTRIVSPTVRKKLAGT